MSGISVLRANPVNLTKRMNQLLSFNHHKHIYFVIIHLQTYHIWPRGWRIWLRPASSLTIRQWNHGRPQEEHPGEGVSLLPASPGTRQNAGKPGNNSWDGFSNASPCTLSREVPFTCLRILLWELADFPLVHGQIRAQSERPGWGSILQHGGKSMGVPHVNFKPVFLKLYIRNAHQSLSHTDKWNISVWTYVSNLHMVTLSSKSEHMWGLNRLSK